MYPKFDMYPFYWTKVKGVFLCTIHMSTKKCVELYRQGIWAGSPDSFKNPRDFRKMIRRWARTEDSSGITVNHKRVQGIMGIRGLRENVQRKNIILTKVKLENLLTI